MTNEKELIKKLAAIVAKQQKIITKLAQAGTPFVGKDETPPAELEPEKMTKKDPGKVFLAALPPAMARDAKASGNDMQLFFNAGQKTQKNYDLALQILQKLTNERKIEHSYNLAAM
jgi:hypothetical protein